MKFVAKFLALVLAAGVVVAQKPDDLKQEPQYYDKPAFIVAGVTDYTSHGSHGSDAIQRSAEALAKATAALSASSGSSAANGEAERRHSLGDREEKAGHAVEALREYQRAVELDASEPNVFDFGEDLLKHHAGEQAAEVFNRGVKLYPRSLRMLLGYAAALYSRGLYDQARERFFEAADLNPNDPTPYLLLGQAQSKEIAESAGFSQRMERFAKLNPENAWANYYYAASIYRRSGDGVDKGTRAKARDLLEKAVRLDPQLGAAWLELGILFADADDYGKAVSAWQEAIAADSQMTDSQMEEAHYRLAQAYQRMGEPAKAKTELEIYQRLSKQSAEALERERAENKQFVFGAKAR